MNDNAYARWRARQNHAWRIEYRWITALVLLFWTFYICLLLLEAAASRYPSIHSIELKWIWRIPYFIHIQSFVNQQFREVYATLAISLILLWYSKLPHTVFGQDWLLAYSLDEIEYEVAKDSRRTMYGGVCLLCSLTVAQTAVIVLGRADILSGLPSSIMLLIFQICCLLLLPEVLLAIFYRYNRFYGWISACIASLMAISLSIMPQYILYNRQLYWKLHNSPIIVNTAIILMSLLALYVSHYIRKCTKIDIRRDAES